MAVAVAAFSIGASRVAGWFGTRNAFIGSVLLAMLPDTGERYFSTPLFEGVNEGSDDAWLAALVTTATP